MRPIAPVSTLVRSMYTLYHRIGNFVHPSNQAGPNAYLFFPCLRQCCRLLVSYTRKCWCLVLKLTRTLVLLLVRHISFLPRRSCLTLLKACPVIRDCPNASAVFRTIEHVAFQRFQSLTIQQSQWPARSSPIHISSNVQEEFMN